MDYPGKKTDEARDKAAQKALDSAVKKHKRLKKGQKLIQPIIPKMRATDAGEKMKAIAENIKEDAYFKEYNSKDFPPSPKFKDVVKMAKKKKKK